MTSLVDLERERTDYFDGALGDVVEPSSSPSEGSPSPLRSLTEDPVADLPGIPASASSHAAGHDPVFNEHEDFHHFRKGHWSHVRDSASSSKKLSSLLMLTSDRLDKEIRRANDAERRTLEAIALARSANEAKLIAERDATRANEELRMYKLQYENAQREIFKAQEFIDQIEAERQDAEAAAARARSTARKLKEQNLIIMAREEGRQLGYQEGLATGRRMAYDERMRPDDYTEDSISEDEIMIPEHPSNIRLRSPTPGAGSRPSSRPPAARQPPPAPPPPMRPPSRSARANFESVPHPSTLATPIRPPPVGPTPPPIHLEATPPPKNRARSKSDPLGYPPDNWIPVADDKSYIAIPPPHHMSPSPSPVAMEPPVRTQNPTPVPPPPVVAEEATVETSTTSETSSETTPPQPSVRPKDYVYHALKIRERDERQPQRSRTPTPLSPGSTRMSDYGILSSPQVDQRRVKAPVQVHHFEIERSNTPTREKVNRNWSLRKKKESVSSSPVLVNASPAPVPPPPITESVIVAPRPRKPGKSPLSRMSPSSSSSSSSTSTAKASTSSTSSTDRTKLDPRKDSSSGGDSRTLGWFFKKRMKEHSGERGSTSGNSVDINIESPSESNHSLDQSVPPQKPPQPALLSPDYRFSVLPPEPPATTKRQDRGQELSTSTPKVTGENQNLPPLAEFTNLISPGQGNAAMTELPPGFVPNPPLNDQIQQGGGGGGQTPRRSASTRSKRKDKEPTYNAAPLTPGVHYPTPPGADIPRSKSRASKSSRQGQFPGALSTP